MMTTMFHQVSMMSSTMAGPWFALDNCLTCSRLSQSRYWLRLKLQEREENSGGPAINTTGGRYCTVLWPCAQYWMQQ